MKITFPEKKADVAELSIDGNPVNYRIPPVTGTHSECFAKTNYSGGVVRATGAEIAAYIHGALIHKKNEWADQERIRFPTLNYLRVPKVLTIVPKTESGKFGDLEGAMLVDMDLKGEGTNMKTEVPVNLSGWKVSEGGILERDGRIVVPYDKWYQDEWNAKHGAVIALFGEEAGEVLEQVAIDSRRKRVFWRVNPVKIITPEKRVPVVDGDGAGRLSLSCNDDGDSGDGCAVRVLK